MSDNIRTENDALIETAREAAGAEVLTTISGEEIAVITGPTGVKVIDLAADEYARRMDRPNRKHGTTTVKDVDSFAQFYAKHADANTETYVDLDAGVITAVLNADEPDAPRWADHWLQLKLTPTEPWKRWTANDRKLLPQVTFAEFLEDNLADIADPPAATMLEIATTFQAKTSVQFASGAVLASGDLKLKYEETTNASAGAKGDLTVPKSFALGIAPFDDVDPYRVEARLRHRIEHGALKLAYILDRPEDTVRDAVKQVVELVETACSIKVMRGAPA